MSREILFRGKSIEKYGYGCWNEGFLVKDDKGSYMVFSDEIDEPWQIIEVDPDTVGQYTGLTDKNGKKIFEDDIMECGYVSELTREYISKKQLIENEKGVYWGRLIGHSPFGDTFLIFCNKRGKIIGNKHDNPELLEV